MEEPKEIILELMYNYTFYARRVAPGGRSQRVSFQNNDTMLKFFLNVRRVFFL